MRELYKRLKGFGFDVKVLKDEDKIFSFKFNGAELTDDVKIKTIKVGNTEKVIKLDKETLPKLIDWYYKNGEIVELDTIK